MVAAMSLSRPCSAVRCPAKAIFRSARPLAAPAPRTQRLARFAARAVDEKQVLEDVRGIIAEQLGTDLTKVTSEAKFVDLGADSLDTVEIMMALEEKFDLQLDEEGAEKIATVQDAADLIAQQIKSA